MTIATEKPADWGRRIQTMFSRISPRYDLMNRLMAFGQDTAWRRAVARAAGVPPGGRVLDIGAGTGGIGREIAAGNAMPQVVCADFTLDMMRVGRRRPGSSRLVWSAADALHLPFADRTFDAVVSGYLIRNVVSAPAAFAEQVRVTRPGGTIVCLDTTPPQAALIRPLARLFMNRLIPIMGRIVAGDADAYTYLPESTQRFYTPAALAGVMGAAGLVRVRWCTRMFGTMAIHVGTVPERRS